MREISLNIAFKMLVQKAHMYDHYPKPKFKHDLCFSILHGTNMYIYMYIYLCVCVQCIVSHTHTHLVSMLVKV